jgi:hypothetical protein
MPLISIYSHIIGTFMSGSSQQDLATYAGVVGQRLPSKTTFYRRQSEVLAAINRCTRTLVETHSARRHTGED